MGHLFNAIPHGSKGLFMMDSEDIAEAFKEKASQEQHS
jgi:hypothetical protein